MDSGVSVRVLLLFVVFGHYAVANVYRYGGSRGVQPYMERASPRSHKPASSYESYSKPSVPSESSRPSQGPSGAYARQVDGYSRQGSVSNYRPASAVSTFRQTSPNVHHSQASAERNKFGSGIVSSGAIEIRDTVKPPRQHLGPSAPIFQSKAGMWNIPSQHGVDGARSDKIFSHVSEVHSSKPSPEDPATDPSIKWDVAAAARPVSYYSKKQTSGSRPVVPQYYSIRPQSTRLTSQVQRQPSSPAKPPQQSASGHILQSAAGMWDLPKPFSGEKHRLSVAHRTTEVFPTPKPYQKRTRCEGACLQQLRAGLRDNAPASSRQTDVEVKNPKPVPVASLYKYEGQRPQLRSMYNRNHQSAN